MSSGTFEGVVVQRVEALVWSAPYYLRLGLEETAVYHKRKLAE